MVTLMTIGVLAIRASEGADATIRGYADQQVVYAAVGLCAFVAVTVVPYARFGRLAYPLFAVTLAIPKGCEMKVCPSVAGVAMYHVFEQFGSFADDPEAAERDCVHTFDTDVVRAEGKGGVKRRRRLFMTALVQ